MRIHPLFVVLAVGVLAMLTVRTEWWQPVRLDPMQQKLHAAHDAAQRLIDVVERREAAGDGALGAEVAGAYEETVQLYEESLLHAPTASAWIGLGRTHLAVGRTGEARDAFVEALRGWPGTPGAYAGLGDVLYARRDYRGAIGNYENALWWIGQGAEHPGVDPVDVRLSLADAYAKLHLPVAAAEAYEQALAARPDSVIALEGLLRIHTERCKVEEAWAVLRKLDELVDAPTVTGLLEEFVAACPGAEPPPWAARRLEEAGTSSR